ncbi:DUF6678 family protein [Persicobacter diffluens]|uniref:DUF6678 family protein n=1 Tax=Persicobacter diffluens TaxID=981 RepID=UPI003B982693
MGWIEINPIKITHVGPLLDLIKEDFSLFYENALKGNIIPQELNQGIFKVNGYKR